MTSIMPSVTLLPSDPDAETHLIACCLENPDSIWPLALSSVQTQHFTNHIFREVWGLASARVAVGKPLAVGEIVNAACARDEFWREFLHASHDVIESGATWGFYAQRLRDAQIKREIYVAGKAMAEMALDNEADADAVLNRAQKLVFATSADTGATKIHRLRDVVTDALRRLEDKTIADDAIQTGIVGVDSLTGGFRPGQLVILAGRTGNGKTALTTQIALHASMKQAKAVLYVSLEMARESLAWRILSGASGVSIRKFESPRFLGDAEFSRVEAAANEVFDAPIFFADVSRGMTSSKIATLTRVQRLKGECDMLVIDYLGLIDRSDSMRKGQATAYEFAEITRMLKMLSQECEIPVVLLVQVSRTVDHREDYIPKLADLRDSGAIEQDADIVLFTVLHEKYTKLEAFKGKATIVVAKNRQGRSGKVDAVWIGEKFRFENAAYGVQNGDPRDEGRGS